VKNNQQLYIDLRKQYQFFEYQSYSFKITKGSLRAEFCFNLSDKYVFKPVITIPSRNIYKYNALSDNDLNNFVFHIGMVELVSYWKAACPHQVVISPHFLNEEQVNWWKKLYFHGLGEFFYLNNIDPDFDEFMSITTGEDFLKKVTTELEDDKVLVPIGGGKDSIVTLELLNNSEIEVIPMIVNPREASIRTINIAGYNETQSVIVKRTIDPLLLELNSKGFLNGHTPFSALLAFTGALSCLISGVSNIALSNESSANESTVPGSKINHQYSKTYEFESDFNFYAKKYLHNSINYFSFLRPINELQIAKLFSGFDQHFDSFRSCNVGSKKDIWCGNCSKCLFTFIALSPFVNRKNLISIFGKDMLKDLSLQHIFDELTGIADVKPFECVGTPEEVVAALSAVYQKGKLTGLTLDNNYIKKHKSDLKVLISEYNYENLLPAKFEAILKNTLNDRVT